MVLKVQSVHSLINRPAEQARLDFLCKLNPIKRALTTCVTRYSKTLRGAWADTEITQSVYNTREQWFVSLLFTSLTLHFSPCCTWFFALTVLSPKGVADIMFGFSRLSSKNHLKLAAGVYLLMKARTFLEPAAALSSFNTIPNTHTCDYQKR